ncbi:hypothetical protein P691DRAFT_765434 [Macrolepiota fuliginosa MF-IS2]|uniref:DUF4219 domain-containing protein n=1 Tax=Macrolepiota fuliginosa MF-IS2 TaxID=1400762 RepID=A0A9P5X251_9AGAR|nr:hypothetical protein P691DRAFT_765434 [Macrolepiota fuliginosa MF-IS2]
MSDAITFDKLNNENYHEWKMYMTTVLIKKDLLNVIDGTLMHPGGKEGTKKVQEFHAKQAHAYAKIILHVSTSQLAHCSNPNPSVIWDMLDTIHTASIQEREDVPEQSANPSGTLPPPLMDNPNTIKFLQLAWTHSPYSHNYSYGVYKHMTLTMDAIMGQSQKHRWRLVSGTTY